MDDTEAMEAADNETCRLYSEAEWPGQNTVSQDQVQTSMHRVAEFLFTQWDHGEEAGLEAGPLIQAYVAAQLLLGLREMNLRESDNSD